MNFTEWCYKYIKDYKSITLKRSTYDSYIRYAKHINISTDLEHTTLDDVQSVITTMHLQGLKYSTIKHTLTVIRQAINKAYTLHMISRTIPFDLLEVPSSERECVHALNEIEARKIVNGPDVFYKDLFMFLLFTGARVGEAIALTGRDVDINAGVIYIRNTDYHGELQSNKSKRTRLIPISPVLREILNRHKTTRDKRIFQNRNNKPCVYYTVRDAWTAYTKRIGIRPCGLHTLRHTFATLAIGAGANIKAVSQILGHSDVNITLNIYTDISPYQKSLALNALEEVLGGAKREQLPAVV